MPEAALKAPLEFALSRTTGVDDTPHGLRKVLKLLIPPGVLSLRRRVGGFARMLGLHRDSELVPANWAEFEPTAKRLLKKRSFSEELHGCLEACEMVMIHGNGCMTGNTRIARAELFIAYISKVLFNKTVALVNHTADFAHPVLAEIARNVYPLVDDLAFREPISADRCATFCTGRVVPDTAFLCEPAPKSSWLPVARRPMYFDVWPDRATFDPSSPYICVGGSSAFGGADPRIVLDNMMLMVRCLKENCSQQIVLTASSVVDEQPFRAIAGRLQLPIIGVRTPVQQVVDILGNADAYVGGRWHPAIFSLRGGTPVVPLQANTFKMEGLGQLTGLWSRTFDPFRIQDEKEAIVDALSGVINARDALASRKTVREQAEVLSKRSWENVAVVSNHRKLNSGRTSAAPRTE